MTSDPAAWSRRAVLAGAAALALAAGPARANPSQRAQALVAQLSRELIALIDSGRGEAQLYGEFEHLLARYADMPAVAQSVLGPPWRDASQPQRQQFVAAFQSYLARRYGRQFRDLQQSRIAVTRVRDAGGAGVLVETSLTRPGRADTAVGWQVSERGGSPRVVNLFIEGVSMLANERTEIAVLLEAQRGSIDGLIQTLRARS